MTMIITGEYDEAGLKWKKEADALLNTLPGEKKANIHSTGHLDTIKFALLKNMQICLSLHQQQN